MGVEELVKEMLPSAVWPHPLPHLRLLKKNGKTYSKSFSWRTFPSLILINDKKENIKGQSFLLQIWRFKDSKINSQCPHGRQDPRLPKKINEGFLQISFLRCILDLNIYP
jgi:hypothetical protein